MVSKKQNSTKKTKKRTTTKKKVEKIHHEYSEFINMTQKEIILSHISEIKELCDTFIGIEPISNVGWKLLNDIVLEVSRAALETNNESAYYILEPIKRSKYTISHQVREMQRKKFILNHIERMNADKDNEAHYCNLIFLHIAILLKENGKL